MAAEDYDDVPGIGSGMGFGYHTSYTPRPPKNYTCHSCKAPIGFKDRKPINKDGTPHRCGQNRPAEPKPDTTQATLFAMAAMNAIVSAQIQAGGVDHIHHMNFYDVADAAWRLAAAMTKREGEYRNEIGSFD